MDVGVEVGARGVAKAGREAAVARGVAKGAPVAATGSLARLRVTTALRLLPVATVVVVVTGRRAASTGALPVAAGEATQAGVRAVVAGATGPGVTARTAQAVGAFFCLFLRVRSSSFGW